MQPIKVLHLIPSLSSGGAERQLANVVCGTSRELINHVVCVIGEAEFFAPDIREAEGKIIELKISGERQFLKTALKFRKIIAEEKPSIIHSRLYDANISSRLAKLLNGNIPIIVSLESPDYSPHAIQAGDWNPFKVRILKMIDRITAKLTKPYFVPCSESVKKSYQIHYGIDQGKTQVIYNSVDPRFLTASEDDLRKLRTELDLPAGAFIYLTVGRLDRPKNHKLLLAAFREVLLEIPNSFLLIAGAGCLDGELKRQATEFQINEKVLFLGSRSDIGALLEITDVFLFPSLLEGLPVALVEAMFKSLPCIASRIDVFEEVIVDGETGLLVDPNSADEFKDAMIELYKNEDLRKSLGQNAFQRATSKFHTAITAKQWEALYKMIQSTH